MQRAALPFPLLFALACRDHSQPTADTPRPVPPLAPAATAVLPAVPAAPPAAFPTDALDGFAGFSQDGKTFAWVAPSPMLPELRYWSTIQDGQNTPTVTTLERDAQGLAQGQGLLKKGGFRPDRKAAPAEVSLELELTANPPKLALVRSGRRVSVDVGSSPYPPSDVAEIWGVSADGKRAAVHIYGRDVPGVFSKGGGGTFHFFFIAPIP